ncbi:hypothetical protein BH23VER1_BH23VER1_03460 [soil metagenome]
MEAGWGDPLFFADWERALFLHFEVDADALQAAVPFDLDLWRGRHAVVSLVAFTMRGMRPAVGGKIASLLVAPLASHPFLNARTYVRCGDERGIYFVREWLPNMVARCVGPAVYGLPYRLGKLAYRHRHETGEISGIVTPRQRGGCLRYHGCAVVRTGADSEWRDFLLERYTACTSGFGMRRKFRVWHSPWNATAVEVAPDDDSILKLVPGCAGARFAGAHYSAGVAGVWMGRPRRARG